MGGSGDGTRGGLGVAAFPVVGAVACGAGVQLGRAIGEGGSAVDNRPTNGVPHRDGLGAVLRRRRRGRDHDRHRLADVAHAVGGQGIPDRLGEGRPIAVPDAAAPLGDQGRDPTDAVGDEVMPGEYAEHPGDRPRRRGVDRDDVGVRVR